MNISSSTLIDASMNSDFSVFLNFIRCKWQLKVDKAFQIFLPFLHQYSWHIHVKIRAWFRYQTIHQVSTDCKWKKCKAFQKFQHLLFRKKNKLHYAWMVKIFLTADMAVGIAPLAVKFAYKNFKYLFKNYQDFALFKRALKLFETSLTCHRK